MRWGKHGASDAHDVGLVGAAPQKNGPADAHDAGHAVCVGENAGLLMLMLLAYLVQLHKKWAS